MELLASADYDGDGDGDAMAEESELKVCSTYNAHYECEITKVHEDGPHVKLTFAVRGDMSVGRLQQPEFSVLNGNRPISHDFTEFDINRRISGTLTYSAENLCEPYLFQFGQGGYSTVDLKPLLHQATLRQMVELDYRFRQATEENFRLKKQQQSEESSLCVTVRLDGEPTPALLQTFPDADVHSTVLFQLCSEGDQVCRVSLGDEVIQPGETFEEAGIEESAVLTVAVMDWESYPECSFQPPLEKVGQTVRKAVLALSGKGKLSVIESRDLSSWKPQQEAMLGSLRKENADLAAS